MYIHMHTGMHTYMHTLHAYIHTYIHTCVYIYIYLYTHTRIPRRGGFPETPTDQSCEAQGGRQTAEVRGAGSFLGLLATKNPLKPKP